MRSLTTNIICFHQLRIFYGFVYMLAVLRWWLMGSTMWQSFWPSRRTSHLGWTEGWLVPSSTRENRSSCASLRHFTSGASLLSQAKMPSLSGTCATSPASMVSYVLFVQSIGQIYCRKSLLVEQNFVESFGKVLYFKDRVGHQAINNLYSAVQLVTIKELMQILETFQVLTQIC